MKTEYQPPLLEVRGFHCATLPLIELPEQNQQLMISLSSIVRIETESSVARREDRVPRNGDGNYTHVFLVNGDSHLVCRKISNWMKILNPYSFFIPHQSHLINLAYLKERIDTKERSELILQPITGTLTKIPLAYRRKREFIELEQILMIPD